MTTTADLDAALALLQLSRGDFDNSVMCELDAARALMIMRNRCHAMTHADSFCSSVIKCENAHVITEEPVLDCQNTSVDPDGDNRASALQVRRRASAQTTSASLPMISYSGDMATIGNGKVTLPANLLAKIDWTSHSAATRQLLLAVFPRRILATRSLTGKRSPAFVNKPLKKQLDPTSVEDIVNIVSAKCGVPEGIVRSCITKKCADEAKLYRNRQKFKTMREQHNQENVPPSSTSSNESTAACEGQETRD